MNGTILAKGGSIIGFSTVSSLGGAGSGGGIRLVANRISGTGTITATGGTGSGNSAGLGRVRLEAFDLAFTGSFNPAPSTATPGPVFPPTNFPSIKISLVATVLVPTIPQGTFLEPPDITLSPLATNPVAVNLEATNIPVGTVVAVTVKTEGGGNPVTVNSTPLVGSEALSTATASVNLPNGTSVISATATFATP